MSNINTAHLKFRTPQFDSKEDDLEGLKKPVIRYCCCLKLFWRLDGDTTRQVESYAKSGDEELVDVWVRNFSRNGI